MERVRLTTVARRGFVYGGPLEVSACGRWLIAWSYHGVRIFDAAVPGAPVWASGERVLQLRVVEGGVVYATPAPHRLIARRFGARGEVLEEALEAALEAAPCALAAAGSRAFVVTADGALRRFVLAAGALVEDGVLAGEPAEAAVMALSADGATLALSRGERKARSALVEVVDAERLAVTHALKGLRAACKCVAFGPDDQMIAAATESSAVVWAGPKAKAQSVFKAARKIEALWWLDAAHLLVTDEQEAAVCVEVASGQERWRHAHYGPASLRAGCFLHARYDKLWLRDARTGAALREIEAPGHPRDLALHPDGEVAFMYTTHGALIRMWRLDQPHVEPSGELGGDKIVGAVASEGWLALGTASGAVLVHALPVQGAPRVVGALRGKYGMGSCEALLIDAARDRVWGATEAVVAGWRLSTGELLASWPISDARGHALYAPPDEDVLLVATDDYYGKQALRVFALGEEAARHTLAPAQRIDAFVSTPGGVMCGGHAMAQRLDLASWQLDAPVSAARPAPPVEQLACEAKRVGVARWLDAARTRWATLHDDGALRVWDTTCALEITYPTGLALPAAIFVVSSGLIVACGEDGEAVLCHIDSTV